MKKFNILKRNRKYFAATMGAYPCKILIDAASENLDLGPQTLAVDDISVRSKYGTDLIFKLKASAEEQEQAGICTLRHFRYNHDLVERCRELDGLWDRDAQAWVFSALVEDQVELLDIYWNNDIVHVQITLPNGLTARCQPVTIGGYTIATASGRDSGATVAQGVALISGYVGSGGSRANWETEIDEGSVLRLRMPKALIADLVQYQDYQIEILDEE